MSECKVPCDTCQNACQDCQLYPDEYCPDYLPAEEYGYMAAYNWNMPSQKTAESQQ